MSHPLLETKLFLPSPRPGLVPRPRLRERLDRGLGAKLMLVSAPAGFGKTTLLVDWLASAATPSGAAPLIAAWLALDAADNDPAPFWRYVVAALRTAVPDIGEDALALLRDSQPPPVEMVLTTLLNELGGARDRHRAGARRLPRHRLTGDPRRDGVPRSTTCRTGCTWCSPSRATRRCPSRGSAPGATCVEVRAADLRFTADEAASYLNGVMGLQLEPRRRARPGGAHRGLDRRAPARRTVDGGTRRRRPASSPASPATTGTSSTTWSRRCCSASPADVQDFLLQTSVLDRMNGSLCDAVTGRTAAGPCSRRSSGTTSSWSRWTTAATGTATTTSSPTSCAARLLDEQPSRVAGAAPAGRELVRAGGRPSTRRSGTPWPAGTSTRAADLIEPEMPGAAPGPPRGDAARLARGPAREVLRASGPVLSNALAGARMSTGDFEGVEELLDATERCDRLHRHGRRPRSSWTRRSTAGCPADIAVHRAGSRARRAATSSDGRSRPPGARPGRRQTTT